MSIGLAIVMLETPELYPAASIEAALQTAFPGKPVTADTSTGAAQDVYSFDIGGTMLFIALMPAPVPWDQLESLAAAAWHWREAATELRTHGAHLLVTISNPPEDPLDADLLLTRATRAVLEAQPAIGVLWGGPAISSRSIFLDLAAGASRETSLPVLCWMSFNIVREGAGKYAIVTQGLERLGHREMELLADRTSKGALEMCVDLAEYVLRRGPVLKPGQTFGRTADEKFPISVKPWRWDPSKEAIVLNMRPAT
jgi:hypothetical protein